MIKLGMLLPPTPDRRWKLAAQAGVRYAIGKVGSVYRPWLVDELLAAKKAYADGGFELAALEGDQFDMSRIKLGLPGRDEDLARYCQMLRAMGEANIPILCFNFMAGVGWFRSRNDIPARGGALTSRWSRSDVPEEKLKFSHEKLWENYLYFLRAVLPEAEKARVKMCQHPDDPPVAELLGYPRILTSADAYRRAFRETGSSALGVTFCAATFRAMGEDDLALMRQWKERIAFFHMRDNRPLPDGFEETFHGDGPTDLVARFRELATWQNDVLLRPDHAPTMEGETNAEPGYAAIGRILAIAYFRGILESLKINWR